MRVLLWPLRPTLERSLSSQSQGTALVAPDRLRSLLRTREILRTIRADLEHMEREWRTERDEILRLRHDERRRKEGTG